MRRSRAKARVSHERWLVSYADFITLLFAFFVVLFSASQADKKRQTALAGAIDSAFHSLGLFPANRADSVSPPLTPAAVPVPALPAVVTGESLTPPAPPEQDLSQVQNRLKDLLAAQIAARTVSLHVGQEGLTISLREAGFYDSGSATPHPGSMHTLEQIARTLAGTQHGVRIEGHTDNVPIRTAQFASNWELSTARATTLARIFIVEEGFAPERLSASGYAEFHPVADNGTRQGRSENRRVDIIVLSTPAAK